MNTENASSPENSREPRYVGAPLPEARHSRGDHTLTPLRCVLLLVILATVVPAIVVSAKTAGLSVTTAWIVAALAGVLAARWLVPLLPADLSPRGRASVLMLLIWAGLGLFGAYRVGHLGVFMHDVEQADHAFDPTIRPLDDEELAKPFFPKHNCFTCYIVACHLATDRVDNIYDGKYYRRAEIKSPVHEQVGETLTVDTYQYPPPFLVLPRLLQVIAGDFYRLRGHWFAFNVIVFVVTMTTVLLWIEGSRFTARWFVLPALFASPVMLGTLQIENAHLLIIMISLLALPAFEKKWHWAGGALLGYAIVSKLFPGLLLVFLLLQRRWRAVWWTGGWMVAYGIATLLMFGPKPFQAFFDYQMPRLASGEAFWFATTYLSAMVKNTSILGIAYKLEQLGVLSEAGNVARIVVWAYSSLLVVVLLVVGLRRYNWTGGLDDEQPSSHRRLALARIWLVLLILGQLRGPFLPWAYGNLAALALLPLMIPMGSGGRARTFRVLLLIFAWVILATLIPLPFGGPTPTLDLIHTLAALTIVLICCAAVVRRKTGVTVL